MTDAIVTDKNQRVLSVAGSLVALGLVGLLWFIAYALVFHEIPTANATSFSTLLGIIGIQVGIVIGYFFGQTMGNRAKDDTIKTATVTAATLANSVVAVQAALPTAADPKEKKVVLDPGESATVKAKVVMPDGMDAVLWAAMTPEQQATAATQKVV